MPQRNPTRSGKKPAYRKPSTSFPLTPHPSGRWCKKIRGKLCYFGRIAGDEDGQQALAEWLRTKDYLLAGKTPPPKDDARLALGDLCNAFLTEKKRRLESGELASRSFRELHDTCKRLIETFGRDHRVDDLKPDDFAKLRADLAKRWGPVRLGNEITRIKGVFLYGFENDLLAVPIKFGTALDKPSAKTLRIARAERGPMMFTADELRTILDAASQPMKAMAMLALNAGFGNTDVANLPRSLINGEWLAFPRIKTGVARRAWLWPETRQAIADALAVRPAPKDKADDNLAFLTTYGQPWVRENEGSPDDAVADRFGELLRRLKLHKPGFGFYVLRRVFRTVADECHDTPAVDYVMGHSDPSMGARYRQGIDDARIKAVCVHVRAWLFSDAAEQAEPVQHGLKIVG